MWDWAPYSCSGHPPSGQIGVGAVDCAGSSRCGPGTAGAGTGCQSGRSLSRCQSHHRRRSWSGLALSLSGKKNGQLGFSVQVLL